AKVIPLSMAGGIRIPVAYLQPNFISEDGAVETADDGTFELKNLTPGEESIKVVHPDYAYTIVNDIEVEEGRVTEGINAVMPTGGTVEGFVYDAKGQVQPGVTLYFQDIYSRQSIEKARRFAEVTTDVNGYYRVGGLPKQLVIVRKPAERGVMGVVCRGLVPQTSNVSRIDLGGSPVVSGQIIINDIPLANHTITLSSTEIQTSDTFLCYAKTDNAGEFVFGGVPNGEWSIYYTDKDRGAIKVATIKVTGQDMNMGTISVRLPTIRISVDYEDGASKWDIRQAYIQEQNWLQGRNAALLEKPADGNEPYITTSVPSGEYYFILFRGDRLTLRHPLDVTEYDMDITVQIPKCTAGIEGVIRAKIPMGQTIWTEDKSIAAALTPDEKGNFKLDNLPAGHYYVGNNSLISSIFTSEFELDDGEQKILDINIPDNSLKEKTGTLSLMVLDENGAPIPGVEASLLGDEGLIEPAFNFDGTIYFTAEEGTYTLQMNFPGYKTLTQQVSIEEFDRNNKELRKPIFIRLERQ
ncbi:MAG: carboxypeptidase-like regulatory domain-containing protein, partial [Phycisphaerae bacterium]|nr:carboxypeptidase-like regulatory domain-containing protein [Phycisphaerae bacterium]